MDRVGAKLLSRSHYTNKLCALVLAVFCALLANTLFGADAQAVRGPWNYPEEEAVHLCNTGGTDEFRGAIWIGNQPAYHSTNIKVNDSNIDANGYTTVNLRGSVFTCRQQLPAMDVWATGIKISGAWTVGNPDKLFRGVTPGHIWDFSSQGSTSNNFKLWVGDVPADGVTHKKTVWIHRCFSTNPYYTTGLCYWQQIFYWVTREKRYGYDIDGQSYSAVGSKLYKNYKNSQSSGLSHAVDEPTLKSGELARFTSNLKNITLKGYNPTQAELWLHVKNSYFRTYQDVVKCERQDWSSCGSGTQTVVWRGPKPPSTQCSGEQYRSTKSIFINHNRTHTYSYTDNCLGMKVPEDGSRIGWYVCQKVSWYWDNTSNHKWDNSVPACFVVKSTFNLVPQIGNGSTNFDTVGQGESVDAPSIIQNNGGIVRNIPVDWATYDFRVPKTVIDAVGGESAVKSILDSVFDKTSGSLHYAEVDYGTIVQACEWIQKHPVLGGRTDGCTELAQAVISEINKGGSQVNDTKLSTDQAQVGDLVCRTMTIRHFNWETRDSSNASRRVAYPKCYRVAKKPTVQIWGNDVRVGSNSGVVTGLPATQYTKSSIITMTSYVTAGGMDLSYGSWGEYGMATPTQGVIQSSSAGGLSGYGTGHAAPSTVSLADRHKLSFANTGSYGRWGTITSQPNIGNRFTTNVQSHAGNFALGDIAAGTYNALSNTVKVSGELSPGKSVIIRSNGTVIIDGDIKYADHAQSNPSEIAQLVIVAKNIIIKDNVSRVDAWLVATPDSGNTRDGIVSTCETRDTPVLTDKYTNDLNANTCNNELHINGPVLARELQLRRTFGAEPAAGDTTGIGYGRSAETINMRAEAYIWAANYIANTTGNIATDCTIELPPRY